MKKKKNDRTLTRDALTMLTMLTLVVLVAIALMVLAGCKTNPSMDYKWEAIPQQPFINADYRYYVIDSNSDIPDAKFETFEEASVYQKEFAENHDYVIVKIKDEYNVYNMEFAE